MAINLRVGQSDVEKNLAEPPLQLHYLPATIDGDGPANVEKFFTPYTTESQQQDGTVQNALRGYPLQGKAMALPAGYTGVILQETKKPLSNDEDRNLTFAGAFRDLTYWNYDRNPSRNDPFAKALNWLQLSEVLHSEQEGDSPPKQEAASSEINDKIKPEKGV